MACKCESRYLVEAGTEAPGMATPPTGGGDHMVEVRPSRSGLVHLQGVDPLYPLVCPHSSSSIGAGCHGTCVAEALSACLSSDSSALGSPSKLSVVSVTQLCWAAILPQCSSACIDVSIVSMP